MGNIKRVFMKTYNIYMVFENSLETNENNH